ncbi:tetratricopeptide repeat protein [Bacteroidota bacterium]
MSRFLFWIFLVVFHNTYSQYSASEYYDTGRSKMNDGEYSDAVDLFTRAIESDSSLESARIVRGEAFIHLGDFKRAISDYDHVINRIKRIDASSSGIFLQRGIAKMEDRDFEGADLDLNMAIELNPLYAEAYYARSRLKYLTLKDKNEALRDIDISIRINPDEPDFFVRRAKYKAYMSRFGFDQSPMLESAIRDLSFAIYIDPDDYSLYKLRSQYNKELGDPLAAVEDYNKMIDLRPDLDGPYSERGIIKMQYDDYESAINDFTNSIELNPEREDCYRYRGLCRHNTLDYQGAIKDYSQSIVLLHNEYLITTEKIKVQRLLADTYLKRGVASISMEKTFNACDDFRRAFELGSKKGRNYMRKFCGL